MGGSNRVGESISAALIWLLLSLAPCSPLAVAERAAPSDPHYLIRHWETEDGLPGNSATAAAQLPDGYLVFGTFGGMVRFDGIGFKQLGPGTQPPTLDGGIINLRRDGSGKLWISGYRGAGVLDGDSFTRFSERDGWSGDYVRGFAERDNGDLLLTMFNGTVQEFRGGCFRPLPPPPGDPKAAYLAHVDEAGDWWVVQHAFVGKWDGRSWRSMVEVTPPTNVGCGRARDGGMWLLIDTQLRKYRRGEEVFRGELPEDPGGFWSLFEDSRGQVWICTHDRGVCRVTLDERAPNGKITMKRWRGGAGLGADGVRFVFEDREGSLWIGTSGGGLSQFRQRRFAVVGTEQGLPRRMLTSLSPDGDGVLLATYGGGLWRWDGDKLASQPVPDWPGGSEVYVQSVLRSRSGLTWIGGWGGLRRSDGVGSVKVPTEPGTNIIALFEDSRGQIWFSGGDSVGYFAQGAYRTFSKNQEASLYNAFCFAEDASGCIWVATGPAVLKLDGERFVLVRDERGEPIKDVAGLRADHDGSMWILGYDRITRWRDGRPAGIVTGAAIQGCVQMEEDAQGFYWMATRNGVVRVNRDDLHVAADTGKPLVNFQLLTKSDGLPTLDFSGNRQPLSGRDKGGRLWFATQKGAVVVNPAEFRVNTEPAPVHIESLTFFDRSSDTGPSAASKNRADGRVELHAPFGTQPQLPPGSRRVQLYFAGLSYASPEKMQFEIKLNGLDTGWQNIGNERTAYYHDLPPGRYTFQVRAANNDGAWNEKPASLAFVVEPFYWQTLWFQLLVAALLISLGAGGAAWIGHARQRLLRQHEERFRRVVEAAPNAMVMVDADNRIVLVNHQTESTFGYGRQQLIGATVEQLVPNQRATKSADDDLAPARSAVGDVHEPFGIRHDGSRFPIEISISTITDGTSGFTLLAIVDISARKRAELESAQQRNELAHLSRVTMLGELSGSLAHELNQPLASILSNAQAAQRFLAHEDVDLNEVRDILKDIVDEDRRAGEVIRRLRLLLKKGEVQKLPLNLNEIVIEVLKLMHSDLINQGVSSFTELTPGLPPVDGDRVQLQQVLLNLVMNACDAMSGSPRGERRFTVATALLPNGDVQVSVSDCGVGIPPEKLASIFEPFVSTKAHGMGLGLTVCRSIITAHAGRLWAKNNTDRGASFQFTLPPSKGWKS